VEDGVTFALVALAAADGAAYLAWGWGTREAPDRRAEVFAAVVTACALVVAAALPARLAAAALVGTLWGRAVWDVLHAGRVPLIGTDIPPRYPWVSLVAKAVATALYLLFAFPA
jgi:hypothetical protein